MTAQFEAIESVAFDNSYARLQDRFFARLPPTPVAAPRLVRLNEKLAWHLRLDPENACRTGGYGNSRGQPSAQERRAARHGLCRPPVRDFRTSTR